jgi:hypothetical protein
LILFSDQIELYIPPKKGVHIYVLHIAGLMNSIHKATKQLSQALKFCQHTKAIVFVISDFMSDGYQTLKIAAKKKHDITGIESSIPEQSMPNFGDGTMLDAETGKVQLG